MTQPGRRYSGPRSLVIVLPWKRISPAVGLISPAMVVQQGGLARAVGADHGDDLPGVDMQGDVLQHPQLAVAGIKIAYLQHPVPDLQLPALSFPR